MTPEKQAELLELIHTVCEGRLGAEKAERLEQLLRGDSVAQAFYLKQVHLHGALLWDLGAAAERDALKVLQEHFNRDQPAGAPLVRPGTQPGRRRYRWLTGLAAAVVLMALAYGFWPRGDPSNGEAPSFAVLAQSVDAAWEDSVNEPAIGTRLGEGKLVLQSGLARIDFDNGASVTLEGPAEFDLLTADHGFLHRGQLTARVPPRAVGFRIDTPGWQVVDRGTSFGVAVEPTGKAEVCVFEGQIDIAPAEPGHAPQQRLSEGSAARIDSDTRQPRPVDFDTRRYVRSWPITFGVLHADGAVRFVPPGPFRPPRRYTDDTHLMVFPEREQVTPVDPVTVTTDTPGRQEGPFDGQAAVLAPGTPVRSYLLQFNPVGRGKGRVRRLVGSITFDRPVLGLIATTRQLAASDMTLGAEGSNPDDRARGIEIGDAFELGADRHTLTVDWTAAVGVDQLRVVVAGK